MGALAVVAFFVALFAIILIHEAGHYLVARAFGFRILEYFVGFGPRLWSFRRGEIEYGVKAIPAGGYVKIAGMNPFQDDVPPGDEHRAYGAKSRWQRALVIFAGPLSHFVVAAIIFSLLLWTTGTTDRTTVSVISGVPAQIGGRPSPASVAGLLPGDVIVRLGELDQPTPTEVGPYVTAHPDQAIPVSVQRGGQVVVLTVHPIVLDPGTVHASVRLGIELGPAPLALLPSIRGGVADVGKYTVQSIGQIGRAFGPQGVARVVTLIFTDAPRDANDTVSVVGVGQEVGAIGSTGNWAAFLWLFAYVTLFIGVVNLIPLPPFDGGHLAVLAIEGIRGRPIDVRKIVPVSAAVLLLLGFFVISTAILDVVKRVPTGP